MFYGSFSSVFHVKTTDYCPVCGEITGKVNNSESSDSSESSGVKRKSSPILVDPCVLSPGQEYTIPSPLQRFLAETVDFFILFCVKATIVLWIMHLSGMK